MERKRVRIGVCLVFLGLLWLCGCSSPSSNPAEGEKNGETEAQPAQEEEASGLVYQGSMERKFAENFTVDYYEGGYTVLTTTLDGRRFLLVPEGVPVPGGIEEDMVVLQQPVQDIYLVASAVMDMFSELGGLDAISFSGQKEENWYIEAAREAMADGRIRYAGKYNKPDYEMIVSQGCSLAVENRMILHAPEVVENLEQFGIPVLVECSSYETHPLGRVEWIRFFGELLGKQEEAERIFAEQTKILEQIGEEKRTDLTVAFFFITSNGLVQIRQPSDYIPKMIEMAGGTYIFEEMGESETKRSTVNIQVEEFYHTAKEADVLIYNSSIDGGVSNLAELVAKCGVLEDFKAVKEGNVWCTTNDVYQQSLSIGYLTEDIHHVLTGQTEGNLHYLFRLE